MPGAAGSGKIFPTRLHRPAQRNMPLNRRAASKGRWLFPTRLHGSAYGSLLLTQHAGRAACGGGAFPARLRSPLQGKCAAAVFFCGFSQFVIQTHSFAHKMDMQISSSLYLTQNKKYYINNTKKVCGYYIFLGCWGRGLPLRPRSGTKLKQS